MNTYKILLSAIIILGINVNVKAQSAGDIAFTGFNADGTSSDGFSFYVINSIPANTTIYFTDNDWDGTSFPTNEGTVEWESTSITNAGETIIIDNYVSGAAEATIGSASETDAGMNISATNDAVYAYIGSLGLPTTFLGAIGNNTSGSSDYNLTGTGLTEGLTAISISGDNDVMVMVADLSGVCLGATCADNIYDEANWIMDNGSGDQSNTEGNGMADFPASVSDPENGLPLPVEFLDFTANADSRSVTLNWSTASEKDNDFFLVEKSIDGGRSFVEIGEVNGSGTVNSIQYYSFEDFGIVSVAQTYYRLKQVDFDGAFEYSSVVNVKHNFDVTTEVYPNPFSGILNISVPSDGDYYVTIYDRSAKVVFSASYRDVRSVISISDMENIKAGIYQLKLTNAFHTVFERIIKQ